MSTATVNELETGSFFSRLVRWVSKGGLAILDQGLISGSNFLVSILLARWLTADQYGAYAVAFGIYLMLTLVYQSLMLEPMGVFSGTTFGQNLRGYVRTLVSIHIALSATIFSALLISWAVSHRVSSGSEVTGALAGIAFASPCLMMFALARRCFYIELSPAPAAAGAFIYSSVVLAGLYVVYHRALLSPFTAFLLLGSGALITGIVLMIGAGSKLSGAGDAPEVRETWGRHWRYGRWALAGTIAGWLPSYIYFPLLSSFTSMAASGQLKALMNLTLPFEQMKGALVMLALPYAARVAGQGGKAGARILGTRLTWASAAGAIMYWAVIIPLYKPIFHLLYSNRYLDVAYLLPALALGQIFWSATFGPSLALRAMESPASVFAALGIATVASLMVGVPATWMFGLKGAIWGSNAADVFSFIALWWALKRKLAAGDAALSSKWFGSKAQVSSVPVEVSEEA